MQLWLRKKIDQAPYPWVDYLQTGLLQLHLNNAIDPIIQRELEMVVKDDISQVHFQLAGYEWFLCFYNGLWTIEYTKTSNPHKTEYFVSDRWNPTHIHSCDGSQSSYFKPEELQNRLLFELREKLQPLEFNRVS